MSHPTELIGRIRKLLEQDYPATQYRYVIEQCIHGTRMYPDIQILTKDGTVTCAVEVGYTRPEKLTAYRDVHKIPDVRWYDKQGNLHTPLNRSSVRVSVKFATPPFECSVYEIFGYLPCDCVRREDYPSLDLEEDELEELQCEAVLTWVITDHHIKGIFLCFCDKCGKTWTEHNDSMHVRVMEYEFLQTPRELKDEHRRVYHGSWDACCNFIREHTEIDFEFSYDDAHILDEDSVSHEVRSQLQKVEIAAARESAA